MNPNPKTNTPGVISGTDLLNQLGAYDTESIGCDHETEAKSKLEVAQQQQELAKYMQHLINLTQREN